MIDDSLIKPDFLTDRDKEILNSNNKRDNYYLIKDLLSGDESIANKIEFLQANASDIKEALNIISADVSLSTKERIRLLSESWRILYKRKQPTIEEFLTEEWIGPTANDLFPHVRKILTEFWAPGSKKRHLILSSGIRTGKSKMSTLSSLFVTANVWCMRNPKRFFNLGTQTQLVQLLISFTMEKAQQVLVRPFMEILKTSPKFRRVKFEETLDKAQEEDNSLICWTTASKMGALQFANGMNYVISSNVEGLLGLDVIQAIMSELSFFLDRGFSSEYIWRVYQDCIGRVQGTAGHRRFVGTVMDSSPNDISLSPIDKYIFTGEAEKNPENYVVTGTQWQYRPNLFPIWQKTGKTFPVFRGNETAAAKVLTEDEVKNYNPAEIYNVPIDDKAGFEMNCLKKVKDVCGWPAGAQGMLISDEKIIDRMFVPNLKNIYSFIRAPENMIPNHLIWNTVHKQFWVPYAEGYEFYRAPTAKRFIHIDQAVSGDVAGISMVHLELDKVTGNTVVVVDFTIAINPDKSRINLDAIRYFIEDLCDSRYGRLNVAAVSYDQFQSASSIQALQRRNIPAERLSVDSSIEPYYMLVAYMSSGRIKCGRNIILKNNLKSLQEVETRSGKRKIDHTLSEKTIYEDSGNWETSLMGTNAKDLGDSLAGSCYLAIKRSTGVPSYVWEDEVMNSTEKEVIESKKKKIAMKLYNKYGFDVSELTI